MLGIEEQILILAAKKEFAGVSMKDCFAEFNGLSYAELEMVVNRLEQQDLVKLVWSGPNHFSVFITPMGKDVVSSLTGMKELEALQTS
jgi:hypothetical protein